ncbi:hypothetical protein N0V86_001051 [Didymella sp. IMI 355093]|nr:hypothetical protein N0V86_001051 [Didymella sp. IMI 355093]
MRHTTPPAKSSRSLGASPIVTQFDVPNRASASALSAHEVPPRAPWNDDEPSKSASPRSRHSSPITKGLWMGDTSPVLAKRTPIETEKPEHETDHQPVLPKDTDGTLEPADLVELSRDHDKSAVTPLENPAKEDVSILDRTKQLLTKPANSPKEGAHVPWPGTILSTSKSNDSSKSCSAEKDEAHLPNEFVMQLSGEISPLLRSSKASLQEVSDDDEFEMLSPAGTGAPSDQLEQRLRWETELISAGDVSDEERNVQSAKVRSQHQLSHEAVATIGVSGVIEVPTKASSPDLTSINAFEGQQGDQANLETSVVGAGDVSPTSDRDSFVVNNASTQALDIQSALESKVIGAGDVSPVSTESSVIVAAPSRGADVNMQEDNVAAVPARQSIERFYTAGIGLDLQSSHEKPSGSDAEAAMAERPRIERFETAQEGAQGSSELTIPEIRRPASRYATVLASEPVVSYKEYTGSSSSSSDNLLEVSSGKHQESSGALTPQRPERADMPSATRQVSATQLHVVHAVEEYAASNSSLASWDQDSTAADAISEPGAVVAMKEESELVTPVAQVPRNAAHHEQHADQAGNFNNNTSQAAPNGYFNENSTADPVHHEHQNPASASNMTVPERSKSLLSIISSAVSSVPISPASSNAGRSTPSTIHRMQRDFSNAKRSNLTDMQIPEEPTSARDDQTPTAQDDDYDLYADHNGVVKDVRDGNGQPLRIASTPNPAPAQLARTTTGASSILTAPDIQDSPGRRYSFERPMSFVSGPQDDDGRPQDQINQPLPGSMTAPPIPPQSQRRSQQYPRASSGAIYSSFEPMQDTHWPPGEVSSQPAVQTIQPPAQEPAPAKVVRQPTRFVPHSHEDEDDEDNEPSAQQSSNLPLQRTPPAVPNGQLPPNGLPQTHNMQEPRAIQNFNPQPRSVSAPLQHMPMASHDSRVVSQPLDSPPAGPATGPRNEFEYQQQMMQLQAKYPRFRGTESQGLNSQQPMPSQPSGPAPEKPASKPRLAAAIKGIVGKTSPNAPPSSNVPPAQSLTLAPTAPPIETSRAESFVSAVSSLSHQPNAAGSAGQPGVVTGPQRPPSLGADSQYSHVSHGSTQVQPAQSRQDLSMPPIPPQFQNLHPQQPPPQQTGQSQSYRASTGAMPDAGKKKRFSAFTGLFGKSNPAAELQGKFKLSREEKKAQKAQRHTSQPLLLSQPTQQWLPPNTQFIAPQQPNVPLNHGHAQNGQSVHPMDPRFVPSHVPPQLHSQGAPAMQSLQGLSQQSVQPQAPSQTQQGNLSQQQRPSMQVDEGSAYLRTKQMAEEHRARQAASQPPRLVYENPNSVGLPQPSSNELQQPSTQTFQRSPPSNGYYYPEKPPPEQGAYVSSHEEQQRIFQLRQQQQLEAGRRLNAALPRSPGEQGAYGASVDARQQVQQQQRPPSTEHGAYGASQASRQQALQQRSESGFEQRAYAAAQEERQRQRHQSNPPLPGPEAFGRSQIHYGEMQQHGPPQRTKVPPQHEHQQIAQNHQQGVMTRDEHVRQQEQELAHHRWQQQQIQLRQFHLQQQAQLAAQQQQQQQQQQQAANRSVSGPLLSQTSPPASPVTQRHVSQPEPQYETPPIPGAYGHVQGVFVSPLDQPHAYSTPQGQFRRQESDPHMQPISPQVSAQSQMPPNGRHHSDASTVSVVSPIAGSTPEPGQDPEQRQQRPRMPSIAEVHQQAPPQQQPWHMNFPPGTTEQDIVRARQKQFFQQQFASQQQAQAERHAASPSPRVSPDKQSPPFSAPPHHTQEQGSGFREVLPRKSPQLYAAPQTAPLERRSPQPLQQSPSHPRDGAGWPLNSPHSQTEPQYADAGPRPLSNGPHTPRQHTDSAQRPAQTEDPQHTAFDQRRYEPTPPNESQRVPPPVQQTQYDENVPDEAPPSYDGPGVPNDGMEKSNPERPRPPNIITQSDDRGRQQDGRPRQVSLGLMQHPQPASMAASPQRTVPDMGAESLRRQMLQQEEHARMERIQRSQMQAAQRQREQQEREAARARAQELERSVSGGGRVGSLRSIRGSHNGGTSGWERRGLQGGNSRPVFELPAVEDDEPVMRATSFPGQEWIPPMYVDD